MKKILFQGDSITDPGCGSVYPAMVEGTLGVQYPGEYECFNKGIGGNRVADILARVKRDIINLEPDYLSILVGVNDVWHEYGAEKNGISAERYKDHYCYMIEQIKESLPNIKIMIMEPFVLKGAGTEGNYDEFRAEVIKRAAVAKEVAEKYGLPFIELQREFDNAAKLVEDTFWLHDGVHPTKAGHKIIADKWLETFEKIKD